MGSKIVFVNRYYDPDESATSQMLTDLARGLARRGHEVHVVTSRQLYETPATRLAANDVIAGVVIHRVATTRYGRGGLAGRAVDYLSFYMSCAILLVKLLRRADVLVVKTDPPLLSILAAPIARLRRCALITWQQDIFPEVASQLGANPLPRWLSTLLRQLRNVSLRAADMNVAIGGRMREYLAAQGIPDFKLCIIENWADAQAIRPRATSESELRGRLGLVTSFVVCYSGNLGRAHEFDTLLGAAELLKVDAGFAFLIIGGGAKMKSFQQAVAAREFGNFQFLPYQPRNELENSLAAADVHIVSLLPSLEGLVVPSKLYGILAAGRPVVFIGDSDGEVGRVIARYRCGVQLAVGDSAALADTLRHLKINPLSLQSMGERSRRILCDHYDFQQALERWVTLIETMSAIREPLSDTHMNPARRTGKL